MRVLIQQKMQLLEFTLTLEFTHMYKLLCKLPKPLVDALLYQGQRQPEWSDEYYQQVVNAYTEWLCCVYAPYRKQYTFS